MSKPVISVPDNGVVEAMTAQICTLEPLFGVLESGFVFEWRSFLCCRVSMIGLGSVIDVQAVVKLSRSM